MMFNAIYVYNILLCSVFLPAHVGALPDHVPSFSQVRVASPLSEKPALQL